MGSLPEQAGRRQRQRTVAYGAKRDAGRGGREQTSQGSSYETARQLDLVGQCPGKIPLLEGHLEHGGTSVEVPPEFCVRCAANTNEPQRWRLTKDPSCAQCKRTANLEHILSSCRASPMEGKFRWCHDQVLAQLADGVEKERKRKRPKA